MPEIYVNKNRSESVINRVEVEFPAVTHGYQAILPLRTKTGTKVFDADFPAKPLGSPDMGDCLASAEVSGLIAATAPGTLYELPTMPLGARDLCNFRKACRG